MFMHIFIYLYLISILIGIGFAIPVDTLKYEVDTLIRDGKIVRPIIGISYLTSSQAKIFGIEKGVLVLEVPENSNAQSAGLMGTIRTSEGNVRLGDIIVGVDSMTVDSESDLFKALEGHKVGDKVTISVIRSENQDNDNNNRDDSKVIKLNLVLSAKSNDIQDSTYNKGR
jgi:S1-C subfamily serine protease